MSAGDILDQAVRIYRGNFIPLVTIVAIVSVPFTLLQAIPQFLLYSSLGTLSPGGSITGDAFNTGTYLLAQGINVLATLLILIAAIFEQGALAAFISERFLGRPITVRQAYGRAFRRWLALLIASFLFGAAMFFLLLALFGVFIVPLIGVTALSVAGIGDSATTSTVAGLVTLLSCCLVIPAFLAALYLYTRWAFYEQAIVLENYNSTGGLGRSWKLVKGNFWRVLGMVMILILIVSLASLGPYLLILFGAALFSSPLLIVAVNAIASMAIVLLMTPLQSAVLTVLYYDLRIRKEGFDLQLQMQGLPEPPALNVPATPEPAPVSRPAPAEKVSPAPEATSQEPPLDLPSLFSRDDYTPK